MADEEIDHLRALLARAHEPDKRGLPGREVIQRIMDRLGARIRRTAVVKLVKTDRRKDAA